MILRPFFQVCLFFFLFAALPLKSSAITYHAATPHPVTVQYGIAIEQQFQEQRFASRIDGKLVAAVSVYRDGSEARAFDGLPDRVDFTVEHWSGCCTSNGQKMTYSSDSDSSLDQKQVLGAYERAAKTVKEKTLSFRIKRDLEEGGIVISSSQQLEKLFIAHPVLKEMLPQETFEALFQQMFVAAVGEKEQEKFSHQQYRLSQQKNIPIDVQASEEGGDLVVQMTGKIPVSTPFSARGSSRGAGTLEGSGQWNSMNGLHFKSEIEVDYSMPVEGVTAQIVSVKGVWIVSGEG